MCCDNIFALVVLVAASTLCALAFWPWYGSRADRAMMVANKYNEYDAKKS
jgi:hypothetical protein